MLVAGPHVLFTAQIPLLVAIAAVAYFFSLHRPYERLPFLLSLGLFALGVAGLISASSPTLCPETTITRQQPQNPASSSCWSVPASSSRSSWSTQAIRTGRFVEREDTRAIIEQGGAWPALAAVALVRRPVGDEYRLRRCGRLRYPAAAVVTIPAIRRSVSQIPAWLTQRLIKLRSVCSWIWHRSPQRRCIDIRCALPPNLAGVIRLSVGSSLPEDRRASGSKAEPSIPILISLRAICRRTPVR